MLKVKNLHLVVPNVDLKLKLRKGKYLPESYDVDRILDENLRKLFQNS